MTRGYREAWKLRQEFAAAFPDRLSKLSLMIGKVQERRRRLELLALKQHGRPWSQEQECGQRPAFRWC